jgi:hypothetical protein
MCCKRCQSSTVVMGVVYIRHISLLPAASSQESDTTTQRASRAHTDARNDRDPAPRERLAHPARHHAVQVVDLARRARVPAVVVVPGRVAGPDDKVDRVRPLAREVCERRVHEPQRRVAPARGRFLHVTDLHPDPFYLAGVAATHACHRARKAKKGAARSGAWGAPASGCDAPLRLVNATLAHLAREWADAVDFVVWTGDSARHDNDRRHPRTPREIYDLNRMVAGWMREAFTRRGIPVIPSIGVCP